MAQLILRGIDDHLVQLLKERAAAHGHSIEEEHRRILQAALQSQGLGRHLMAIPEGDDLGVDRR